MKYYSLQKQLKGIGTFIKHDSIDQKKYTYKELTQEPNMPYNRSGRCAAKETRRRKYTYTRGWGGYLEISNIHGSTGYKRKQCSPDKEVIVNRSVRLGQKNK